MKYFSPNILDGSVTTAKIADGAVDTPQLANGAVEQLKMGLNAVGPGQLAAGAVGTSKLFTITDSQSGNIGSLGTVTVTLNAYSFFPDVIFDDADVDRISIHAVSAVSGSPDADNPRFALDNSIAASTAYDVEWRNIAG